MKGIATAENVSHRKFLTMTMDQVYSAMRPPLEVGLTFPSPPLPGAELEVALYYAEAEDESVADRQPDIVQKHSLTEADIANGLTLTLDGVEDVPYLFARAYVDIDDDGELSYGDIAMFYGEKSVNSILQGSSSPENIGALSRVTMAMSLWHADEDGPLTDIDGNVYRTVTIGDLEWMAENLKVTHYRNGAPIPAGFPDVAWLDLTSGAYAVYPYEMTSGPYAVSSEEEMIAQYGLLYNGYAVMDPQGLAPAGWRVATDEDYKALEREAGMQEEDIEKTGSRGTVGAKLRSTEWTNLPAGTDDFGFGAMPGGFRQATNGNFVKFGLFDGNNLWTSSTGGSSNFLYRRSIRLSPIDRALVSTKGGLHVRCVRDR